MKLLHTFGINSALVDVRIHQLRLRLALAAAQDRKRRRRGNERRAAIQTGPAQRRLF